MSSIILAILLGLSPFILADVYVRGWKQGKKSAIRGQLHDMGWTDEAIDRRLAMGEEEWRNEQR